MATIADAFREAVINHQAGRLQPAEETYRQILRLDPQHADAMHLLGLIDLQLGRHNIAEERITAAVALRPHVAAFHGNLGNVYLSQGKLEEAATAFRQMVALQPDSAGAFANLGETLRRLGRFDEAIQHCRQALALEANMAEAHSNLGIAYRETGQLDLAIEHLRRAISLQPNQIEPRANLSSVLTEMGQLSEAIESLRLALSLNPQDPGLHCKLGLAFRQSGELEAARDCYLRALQLDDGHADAHNNLGAVYEKLGQFDAAMNAYSRALKLRPEFAEALNNLGNLLRDTGDLPTATACYRRALQFQSGSAMSQQLRSSPAMHSNLLLSLNYDPEISAIEVFKAHTRWGEMYTPENASSGRHSIFRDRGRKLRIGYVSPDLRKHPVGYFIEPILATHDSSQFEIVCYSDARETDEFTTRMQQTATVWKATAGLSHTQFSSAVRADAIDILIDLAGHTAGNRLPALADKLAPVQMTYLGYPNTTGLQAIDYRITDEVADPDVSHDESIQNRYTEQLVRLSGGMVCYRPPMTAPPVGRLPAISNGYVTFGSLHNLAKVNHQVIELWSQVLRAVPRSRLLLFRTNLLRSTAERLLRQFEDLGIDRGRLLMTNRLNAGETHLDVYHQIDISLDTLPWSGHTTTCESLWMGVPMITCCGDRAAGRLAASALSSAGLQELIAMDGDQFVAKAVQLAGNLTTLAEYRASLRERLMTSRLCDKRLVTRELESAYRRAWSEWCSATE